MATQFGGGKTHALTLLYHLAENGSRADGWSGVRRLLERAAVSTVPQAETAVFVGTEFDSISGRGGDDGTPHRRTPWGEIAYQLGGDDALAVVAEHEKQLTAPAGDVIRRFLPADRRANINQKRINEHVRAEVREVFAQGDKLDRVYFPEKSGQIPDRPALTLVVCPPDEPLQNDHTLKHVEEMTRESSNSSRTFKSALIWCVADAASSIHDEARKVLAWEDIEAEEQQRLDEGQRRQLTESLAKAKRDLSESVWRTYKNVLLLGKDNSMRVVDLGLVHSSSANSLVALLLNRLRQDDDVVEAISPRFVVKLVSGVQGVEYKVSAGCLLCIAAIPASAQPASRQGHHCERCRRWADRLCR